MNHFWRWAGAKSIGTSHIKSCLPCQDFIACTEFDTPAGTVFASVVSDGAGSASQSETGARVVCGDFLRSARKHLISGAPLESIDRDIVLDWLDTIREHISQMATRSYLPRREWAATLVGLLVGPRSAVVIHIGDGAAVVRVEGNAEWLVPSWPFHGEYASTTTFVTDDPIPEPSIVHLPVRLNGVAVFSDGIERLVLDHGQRIAHRPFFDRVIAPVAASRLYGHDRALSKALRDYLGGVSVCERTDDDKSLLIGLRL